MMTLADVSAYFDRTPVLDPNNDSLLFMGQVDPYDDSRRDAGAAYRRVLSVKPGTLIPTNRTVKIFNQVWLVGTREADGLAGLHREKYVLQRADMQLSLYRLADFLTGAPAAAAVWGNVEWLKDVKQIEVDSRMPEQCSVFAPLNTPVQPRDVFTYAGSALLVLETHDSASAFEVATALRLDQAAPTTATITPRSYTPGSGFAPGADFTAPALRVRWQSLFEYGSQADTRFQEGDCSIVLAPTVALTGKDRITLDGIAWSVVSIDALAGAKVVHARRA